MGDPAWFVTVTGTGAEADRHRLAAEPDRGRRHREARPLAGQRHALGRSRCVVVDLQDRRTRADGGGRERDANLARAAGGEDDPAAAVCEIEKSPGFAPANVLGVNVTASVPIDVTVTDTGAGRNLQPLHAEIQARFIDRDADRRLQHLADHVVARSRR